MALDKDGKEIVEPAAEAAEADAELDKELAELEANKGGEAPAAPAPQRSELDKATFNLKSNLKRVKELGGDPTSILGDELPDKPEPEKVIDTSEFVTKKDLAYADAQKMAKTPGEFKLMKWWMDNRGLSAEDAHFMANKNRIKKTLGEVERAEALIPSPAGAGAGERPAEKTDAPDLPQAEKSRLLQSGMVYDPVRMSYVGKKVEHKYDKVAKVWMTKKL